MPKDKQDKGAKFELPSDLSALGDDELASAIESATAEFDALDGDESIDVGGVARMGELAEHIETMRGQQDERAAVRAQAEADREGFRSRVHKTDDEESAAIEDETQTAATDDEEDLSLTAGGSGGNNIMRRKTPVENVIKGRNANLNVRLSQAREQQPKSTQPSKADLGSFAQSVLVASADIPGFTQGGQIADGMQLVEAFKQRARTMGVSRSLAGGNPIYGRYYDAARGGTPDKDGNNAYGLLGYEGDWRLAQSRVPVAQLQRQFRYNLDSDSTPEQSFEVMQAAANPQALVAAGGWCSPSEISYDFYNIVAEDGAYDLPTTGIRRGGMRWPTSPSYGDVVSSTGLWHWTETQDIAAATGTGQSGTKTCARVPCAAFNEARLEGEGICITAGNLTTDAWPEQIANFMRLVNAVHFHRVNQYFINNVIAQSTAVTLTQTNSSPIVDILSGVEHQVWDIRTKYAMADTDILEVVFPSWVLGLIRADVARRNGIATLDGAFAVTNAMIASWFTQRYVRVQFIQDFDVRGSNQFGQSAALNTAWPATVRFLIYPAGTFVRGNGMNLDLGIVRDSTLNATNDYTAAWSEEFFLLAKIGHESRIVTLGTSASVPTGYTGSQVASTGI